jgi:type II protein arginine methyltransferase
MAETKTFTSIPPAVFDSLAAQAGGDPAGLAALSAVALTTGRTEQAYALARQARALAPGDAAICSMTSRPLNAGVPGWHFRIVRDEKRNADYEAALKRVVTSDSLVLDIGAGTGLLALMAARAGARSVVSCEMNPPVADAATDIVALNGYADRVRVVAKRSTELDVEQDMGGKADVLVSEIVSNDMLGEGALGVMEDAVERLLKPGGAMIPSHGQMLVALAYWQGLQERRLTHVAGFDVSPFNRLEHMPRMIDVGSPDLALRSESAILFNFDFASGGPFPPRVACVSLKAHRGPINGIIQWIRLRLDPVTVYENRPAPGASSCWAARFHALDREIDSEGSVLAVHGAHTRDSVRIWAEA